VTEPALTLAEAGVSRSAAAELIRAVLPLVRGTDPRGTVLPTTDFAGAVRWGDQALVASTDGVGTKRTLMRDRMADLGQDLVAYNVNDVVAVGARPLLFLDYLSVGRIDPGRATELFVGMTRACRAADCVLLGGETAEHPGVQAPDEFDLAGFAVGVAPVGELVSGETAVAGYPVVGIESSGPHASGFSLIRLAHDRAGLPVAESMLRPTPVYVGGVRAVRARCDVHAMAHVCDGGLTENVPRGLPDRLGVVLRPAAWPRPAWVDELRRLGCAEDELRGTVNMGIGFTLVVAPDDVATAVSVLAEHGHRAWVIGEVTEAGPGARLRYA
jgi:phosphoribosylformylglycinamidine cyclo-ligase